MEEGPAAMLWEGVASPIGVQRVIVEDKGRRGLGGGQSALLSLPAETKAWRWGKGGGEAIGTLACVPCAPWQLIIWPVSLGLSKMEGPQASM